MKFRILKTAALLLTLVAPLFLVALRAGWGQDSIAIGINLGAPRIRMAVSDFQPQSVEQNLVSLTQEFNQVLSHDLENAGIFDMVSKSFMPVKLPAEPADVDFNAWSGPPSNTQMLAFGKIENANNSLVVTARLWDVKNLASPSVIQKRYVATMNEVSTREAAHRFANEIIQALGGGVPGVNLTRIAFVSNRTGAPEIWAMDYDGFNQHPITSYRSIALTPRWSPDNTRLAFTSYSRGNPEIFMYSLEINRLTGFPTYKGLNTTPAWSPDGKKIAFCSSMSGDPEIYVSDANGYNLQRLTFSPGVDISPVWNPKTGNEIAFVSDRSGTPQVYIMGSDGSNLRRLLTGGGDTSGPTWSPNGLFIAFHWRHTDTGTYDIYLIEIASGRIIQLTHDAARNESPVWAPDGRHIVFQSTRGGNKQIWTMLANGDEPRQITKAGENWNPNWSN